MRCLAILAVLVALSGCAATLGEESSPEFIAEKRFVSSAPASITVITIVNNRTGGGGHTALLINGSQRVIFDPAGSFRDPRIAERGDVVFGVTPSLLRSYKSAHARDTYHAVSQEFLVTPEQAERALQLALSNGPVASAYCANATTALLRQVPGFGDVKSTFFPKNLMEQMATRAGVVTSKHFENDAGVVVDGIDLTN